MSAPSVGENPTDTKGEESQLPVSKCDSTTTNSADAVSNSTHQSKAEAAMNGALPETETKSSSVGQVTVANGQDGPDKPAEVTQREVPDLLPLQPQLADAAPATVAAAATGSTSASPAGRQAPPPLLPMKAAVVVATKSAPPPLPTTPVKTRETRSKAVASPAVASTPKEKKTPALASKSPKDKQQPQQQQQQIEAVSPPLEKEPKKWKVGAKKRDSVASSGIDNIQL